MAVRSTLMNTFCRPAQTFGLYANSLSLKTPKLTPSSGDELLSYSRRQTFNQPPAWGFSMVITSNEEEEVMFKAVLNWAEHSVREQLCLLEMFKLAVRFLIDVFDLGEQPCSRPWEGARMFEMSPSQDMGAYFWLVELFRDGGEETKQRLGSRSTRLRFELCTSACETYMMQFLLKIFRSVLNLLSAELPDSRGIFVRLESQTVWLKNDEKWWLNLYLISQAARPAACTQHESPSWREGHTCTKLGHWTQHTSTTLRSLWNGKAMTYFLLDLASCTTVHEALGSARNTVCGSQLTGGSQPFRRLNTTHFYCPFLMCCALNQSWVIKWVCVVHTSHFYCPLVTLKWKSDDLFFAWPRKLHDGARGPRLGAHSVWQPADERVTTVSKTVHITLLLPFSGVLCLESVMSDKMCGCVCAPTVYKLGSQIDFSVFCISLQYFRRIPTHMQPKSVSFSFPLACSSCLALKRICCHCHSQHVFLVSPGSVYAILSNTASLRVPRFGAEHCREYCTSKIQAPWSAREVN